MGTIQMKTPLVELDGDEMTRVLWAEIKDRLLAPYINLKTEYYDLSLQNRDASADAVTTEAALAIRRLGVGVKCATITANSERQREYNLQALHPSPNATIRALLDGTVFRAPIAAPGIPAAVASWKKPIVIGRHAYGDVYKAAELYAASGNVVELCCTDAAGNEQRVPVAVMRGGGVVMAMHNLDDSIRNFARCCFRFALAQKLPVWFSAKDTISKIYDGRFKSIFADVYETEFKTQCETAGISYFYTLIDDAVSRIMHSDGGILWACKNYDGDVMSDMVASASGSLAMMTSVLVSPDGAFEYEAAHGTIRRHYYRYRAGEKCSSNPVALLFAWTGALAKRGELDGLPELGAFAASLERAALDTIAAGFLTADLARIAPAAGRPPVDSWTFLDEIKHRLEWGRGAPA
ncbi:MAG: NADP-dependent isocitrate dehydrogenase [Spirochaetaceae bacterium]|jgi:isocitrate dehydrogenase|nr:NADP-dependent isocitrate dehydrogenase [Spirochaetaceae bacterium]